MTRSIILLFSIILPLLAAAQKMPEIKALNRVILHRQDTLYEFYTAQPPKRLRINQNKYYYWYRQDSILSTQGGFAGKLLHGKFTVLFPNRALMQEGTYKYGLKAGTWKLWNEHGKLVAASVWENGIEQLSRRERKRRQRAAQ